MEAGPPTELLQQFAAGDLSAFESLFRQFQGEVYAWIVRMVRDPATAEDLTIETFWRIHRAHARFDSTRSFGAWARRIATNVALDHIKTARPRMEEIDENVPSSSGASEPNPAIRRELRERTRMAFLQLPPQLRVIATLALVEQQSHREIAEALNLSTVAVKSRVFRAMQLLRTKLGNLT